MTSDLHTAIRQAVARCVPNRALSESYWRLRNLATSAQQQATRLRELRPDDPTIGDEAQAQAWTLARAADLLAAVHHGLPFDDDGSGWPLVEEPGGVPAVGPVATDLRAKVSGIVVRQTDPLTPYTGPGAPPDRRPERYVTLAEQGEVIDDR